jgi:hypothetical protein
MNKRKKKKKEISLPIIPASCEVKARQKCETLSEKPLK